MKKSVSPNPKSKNKEEEEKIIEELTEEVFKKYKDIIKNISSGLNFSSSKFQLKSFDSISKMPKLKPDKILEVDVSNNKLKSIDILNGFSRLREIKAHDNKIEEIDLKLDNLEDLDISGNKLQKVYYFNT